MRQGPRILSIVLGALLFGVLVRNWALVPGLLRTLTDDSPHPLWSAPVLTYVVVVGGFLVLLAAAAIGLLRVRPWGIYCGYALVPVSTILHGIPLVPLVSDLLPTLQFRIAAVFVLNIAFLTAIVILHASLRRDARHKQHGLAT